MKYDFHLIKIDQIKFRFKRNPLRVIAVVTISYLNRVLVKEFDVARTSFLDQLQKLVLKLMKVPTSTRSDLCSRSTFKWKLQELSKKIQQATRYFESTKKYKNKWELEIDKALSKDSLLLIKKEIKTICFYNGKTVISLNQLIKLYKEVEATTLVENVMNS